jgi:hypothetical protein
MAPAGTEYATQRCARDVVPVLDELGTRRAHVHSPSMGGKIAQCWQSTIRGRWTGLS